MSRDLFDLKPRDLKDLSDDKLASVLAQLVTVQQTDLRENALLYYQPATDTVRRFHASTARVIGAGGGNGSGKTEVMLAEIAILATGIVPLSLRDTWDYGKCKGPGSYRIVCESLTTVLHPILLPKLQWFKWTGVDAPGGQRGHWGWIPRTSLINGSWEKSWSEKLRTLRVLYRNPRTSEIEGESTIQCMSFDQDASDFASGDFHAVAHDEPPPHSVWRENQARTMRVGGRCFVAMTWPDDPSIPVDWIFDEIYEPGLDASRPDVEWLNFFTTDNPHLNQDAIAQQMKAWSPEIVDVRIYGRPIRFHHRVHPEFTAETSAWCFDCRKRTSLDGDQCRACRGHRTVTYNHVRPCPPNKDWPTVWLLDPHPRKPHMWLWLQITPGDDLHQIGEGSLEGDPKDVAEAVLRQEELWGVRVVRRMIDPNMGRSPAGARRGITWQDEFDRVGLRCDLANDSDVGRSRLNDYLRPDPDTYAPRVAIDPSCHQTIQQIQRYTWDDHKRAAERDLKQKPKDKNDDFPTLWKYALNEDPGFRDMALGTRILRRRGERADPLSRRRQASLPRDHAFPRR